MATPVALGSDLPQLNMLSDETYLRLAEEGLPTDAVAQLRSLGISFTEVAEVVIPPRTLKHRVARGERLSTEESERLLRVFRTVAHADRVFGDHQKALGWLRDLDPRLDDRNCLSLLRTEAGGRLVENMLGQIEHGYFS
jgi:putative toxin-antitoxin system antitoxin component (TIGR02293 family)